MYENGTVRNVETVLGKGSGGKGMIEGVNLTRIYCKNFFKDHNVPPIQQ
jgi:hypothetical protein